ncbi:hypothetical protein Tco_0806416 [Tanacetum coccineum]
MDPNSSLGEICLGENVVEISSDKIKRSRDWDSPKYQDTANSGGKKETKAMVRSFCEKKLFNPEEDDVELGVIFRRSFLCMTKAITDFGARTITIYPDNDPFLKDTEEEEKSMDDWGQLLDFNLDDIPLLGTSSSTGRHLTQEEAAKEALALRI